MPIDGRSCVRWMWVKRDELSLESTRPDLRGVSVLDDQIHRGQIPFSPRSYRFTSNIATGARSDSPMGSEMSFSQPKRARLSASRASS
mgnify:CR=1 FL=1